MYIGSSQTLCPEGRYAQVEIADPRISDDMPKAVEIPLALGDPLFEDQLSAGFL